MEAMALEHRLSEQQSVVSLYSLGPSMAGTEDGGDVTGT